MEKILPKTTRELELFRKAQEATLIDPHQTVAETSRGIGGQYMQEFKKLLDTHKTLVEPYVVVAYRKKDLPIKRYLKITFVARRTIPEPEWQTDVYLVSNRCGRVELLWSLPTDADARQILKRPDLFDDKIVDDCKKMLDNSLSHATAKKIEAEL